MNVPTKGESYSKLYEYLRLAQEEAAMLSHLAYANQDQQVGMAWLQVEELLKKMLVQITSLAMRGMQ